MRINAYRYGHLNRSLSILSDDDKCSGRVSQTDRFNIIPLALCYPTATFAKALAAGGVIISPEQFTEPLFGFFTRRRVPIRLVRNQPDRDPYRILQFFKFIRASFARTWFEFWNFLTQVYLSVWPVGINRNSLSPGTLRLMVTIRCLKQTNVFKNIFSFNTFPRMAVGELRCRFRFSWFFVGRISRDRPTLVHGYNLDRSSSVI